MMIVTASDENPRFKALSDNIVGSAGIFMYDDEEGGIAALVEKGQSYVWLDISEVVRKNAEGSTLKSIK